MRDEPCGSRSRDDDDPAKRRSGARDGNPPETFHVDVPDGNDPCLAIVGSVAAVAGTEPTELPLLARSVDPDALRRLVSGDVDSAAEPCVRFTYAGHLVSIDAEGELTIRGPDPSA